jgi:hypothetical protein
MFWLIVLVDFSLGMAMGRVLYSPFPYPHFEKIPVPMPNTTQWTKGTIVATPLSDMSEGNKLLFREAAIVIENGEQVKGMTALS